MYYISPTCHIRWSQYTCQIQECQSFIQFHLNNLDQDMKQDTIDLVSNYSRLD